MRKFILVFLVCLIASPVFAESIKLKSGEVIEGKIGERGNDFIKVDQGIGVNITYYWDDLISIDGKEIAAIKGQAVGATAPVPVEKATTVPANISQSSPTPMAASGNDKPVEMAHPQEVPVQASATPVTIPSAPAPVLNSRQNNSSEDPIQGSPGTLTITDDGTRAGGTSVDNQSQSNQEAGAVTESPANKAFSGRKAKLAGLGKRAGAIIFIIFIVIITFLIFGALCLQIISQKTKRGTSWMAWVPIASLFLMCKIGGVRYNWLWLLLLGVIPVLGMLCVYGLLIFIWYKIALALNKPGWWGVLAGLPLVNVIAMGYLAFSDSGAHLPNPV